MKRFFPLFLASCVVLPFAPIQAHLGETLEQTGQRYGDPFVAIKDGVVYKKNGFQVGVYFVDGVVEGVTYEKLAKSGLFPDKISSEEIVQLIRSNAPDKKFTEKQSFGKAVFLSDDGDVYCDYNLMKHFLVIMTKKGRVAMEEKNSSEAKATTGGM